MEVSKGKFCVVINGWQKMKVAVYSLIPGFESCVVPSRHTRSLVSNCGYLRVKLNYTSILLIYDCYFFKLLLQC